VKTTSLTLGFTEAHYSVDKRYLAKGVGCEVTFLWRTPIQHDFKIKVKIDGSLVFTGQRPGGDFDRERRTTTLTVTLAEWQTNRETIDHAFELVYRDPEVWDEKRTNSFRG
jgi:hypothetical protein